MNPGSEPQPLSRWQITAASSYFAAVALVVTAARIGLYPGVGSAFPGTDLTSHPYRLAMAITLAALAAALGAVAAGWPGRESRTVVGLAVLLAGGLITGAMLGAAPWLLYPADRYPVAFLWIFVGPPVALVSWLALRLVGWGKP